MFVIAKTIKQMIESYKSNDLQKCKTELFILIMIYNRRISEGKPYDHDLKHILFKSNFIRNPMGMKYTGEDLKNTSLILLDTLFLLKTINNPKIEMPEYVQKDLTIDSRLTDDLIDLAAYTNCFFQMNAVNTKRMDECETGKLPFLEQLMTVLVFFQDQARLLRQSTDDFRHKDYVTGMELSVANKPVEYYDNLKGSISDNLESSLESVNEIVHYLYYQYGKNLKTAVTDADINFKEICPYENEEFQKYVYIAGQRHLLCRMEEGIRYGYYELGHQGKSDEGIQCYLFVLENDEKYKARRIGLLRRIYQFQNHALLDPRNQTDVIAANEALPQLSKSLIDAQAEGCVQLNLSGFHPDRELFLKAEGFAKPKIHIVEMLTRDYYLDCTVKDVKMRDLLCAYSYLATLTEIVFASASQMIDQEKPDTFVKEICLADVSYLSMELSRIHGFQTGYAEKLLDRFIFHEQKNRYEDIFAQPLLKISKTQVVLSQVLLDQMNIDRAIERQFIRFDKDVSPIGHIFEKEFVDELKKGYSTGLLDFKYREIPNFAVNTNQVEFVAFDGKDIEFDVIAVLGDCLILTELKAVMASYDFDGLEKRREHIKTAVSQLRRRAESVRNDWETIKKLVSIPLPDQPFDRDHIILVACTDAYDYTPMKDGDVFITDDSTYLKYFTNPYIDVMEKSAMGIAVKRTKCLWKKGYPNAAEFRDHLMEPVAVSPFSSCLEKVRVPVPVMDKDDSAIFFEDYILNRDPILKTALKKQRARAKKKRKRKGRR